MFECLYPALVRQGVYSDNKRSPLQLDVRKDIVALRITAAAMVSAQRAQWPNIMLYNGAHTLANVNELCVPRHLFQQQT